MQKLNSERLNDIFLQCMFHEKENKENHVTGEGIKIEVGFHPERLEKNKREISEMLDELPDEFRAKDGGGGWSFLNMCQDKHGNQWADLHSTMEQLVTLGNAIGRLKFAMPREFWGAFPGGVPYIIID